MTKRKIKEKEIKTNNDLQNTAQETKYLRKQKQNTNGVINS